MSWDSEHELWLCKDFKGDCHVMFWSLFPTLPGEGNYKNLRIGGCTINTQTKYLLGIPLGYFLNTNWLNNKGNGYHSSHPYDVTDNDNQLWNSVFIHLFSFKNGSSSCICRWSKMHKKTNISTVCAEVDIWQPWCTSHFHIHKVLVYFWSSNNMIFVTVTTILTHSCMFLEPLDCS